MRWRILIPSFCISVVFHTSALKLRSCQGTFLESFLDALKAGSTKIGVHLPAAIRAGETVVFISLLERLRGLPRYPEVIRSLVIVDSVELARQAVDQAQARKLFHHRSVETEQGARCTASGIADVTVATHQTLLRALRLLKFDPAGLKAVTMMRRHVAALS